MALAGMFQPYLAAWAKHPPAARLIAGPAVAEMSGLVAALAKGQGQYLLDARVHGPVSYGQTAMESRSFPAWSGVSRQIPKPTDSIAAGTTRNDAAKDPVSSEPDGDERPEHHPTRVRHQGPEANSRDADEDGEPRAGAHCDRVTPNSLIMLGPVPATRAHLPGSGKPDRASRMLRIRSGAARAYRRGRGGQQSDTEKWTTHPFLSVLARSAIRRTSRVAPPWHSSLLRALGVKPLPWWMRTTRPCHGVPDLGRRAAPDL